MVNRYYLLSDGGEPLELFYTPSPPVQAFEGLDRGRSKEAISVPAKRPALGPVTFPQSRVHALGLVNRFVSLALVNR